MKRRLYKLVLFLHLGAIVNVAVAWGCANWIDVYTYSEGRGTMSNTVANGFWEVMRYSKSGAIIHTVDTHHTTATLPMAFHRAVSSVG